MHVKRSVRTSRRWEAEEDLLELRRQMQSRDSPIALDLEDVTLVGRHRSPVSAGLRVGGSDVAAWFYILARIDREREGNG